jgi:hypothetical protein
MEEERVVNQWFCYCLRITKFLILLSAAELVWSVPVFPPVALI